MPEYGKWKVGRKSPVRRLWRRMYVDERDWVAWYTLQLNSGEQEYPPEEEWNKWPVRMEAKTLGGARDKAYTELQAPGLDKSEWKRRRDIYHAADEAHRAALDKLRQARLEWWQDQVRRENDEQGWQNLERLQNKGMLSMCAYVQSCIWGLPPYLAFSAGREVAQWWQGQVAAHETTFQRVQRWATRVAVVLAAVAAVAAASFIVVELVGDYRESKAEQLRQEAALIEWEEQRAAEEASRLADGQRKEQIRKLAYPEQVAAEEAAVRAAAMKAEAERQATEPARKAQQAKWDAERREYQRRHRFDFIQGLTLLCGGVVGFLVVSTLALVAFGWMVFQVGRFLSWAWEWFWILVVLHTFVRRPQGTESVYNLLVDLWNGIAHWFHRWVVRPLAAFWSGLCWVGRGIAEVARLLGGYAAAMYRGICPLLEFEEDPADAEASE